MAQVSQKKKIDMAQAEKGLPIKIDESSSSLISTITKSINVTKFQTLTGHLLKHLVDVRKNYP